jgi:hypothetical protein
MVGGRVYMIHDNHTGSVMSMGTSATYSTSRRNRNLILKKFVQLKPSLLALTTCLKHYGQKYFWKPRDTAPFLYEDNRVP